MPMRAVFGIVSLLVALAVVGLLASRQLKAVHAPIDATVGAMSSPASAVNVREQSQQIQQRVADDVNKALAQGTQRLQDADK
jgi:hypothetical protein